MPPRLILGLMVLLAALPAWSQRRSGQGKAGQGLAAKLGPQPEMHDGHPALRFEGREGWALYVDEVQYKKEPALRFPAAAGQGCGGALLVSETHVALLFPQSAGCPAFDLPRAQVQVERQGGKVTLSSGANTYTYIPLYENGGQRHGGMGFGGAEYLVKAVQNFEAVLQQFHQATAGLTTGGGTPAAAAAESSGKKGKGQASAVDITTQPGGAQVYINDEPRGTSSEQEGRLVLKMPPGTHTLRVSLPNYKDFTQEITVTAGQPLSVTAKLEPLGPPPFTADDIVKMLQGKVSNKRIASLVDERGVDFALTPEIEKRLKTLGADDALLLEIATKKR